MAKKFQHYVPQVYLKAWETEDVCSIKDSNRKSNGVYYYSKDNLAIGERRNTKSILAQYHTYTVDYEHSFVFKEMPEVARDYGLKICEVLNSHDAVAYYLGKELKTICALTSQKTFSFLDDWNFYKKENPKKLAKKNAIISDIKNIRSYIIEDKLDDFLEKEWTKTRDDFIYAVEGQSLGKNMVYVEIDKSIASKLIYSMLLLMCRNPVFDCLGIFPKIGNTFMKIFSMNGLTNEEYIKSQKVVDQQMHAAWLSEIYKGLYDSEKGFCKLYAEKIPEKCNLVLLRIPEENGSIITSDNPAFMFINNLTRGNKNGFYMPLTPQYLLLIGKGGDDINSVEVHTISNQGVRFYNSVILSKATSSIVSNKKYLGYIL